MAIDMFMKVDGVTGESKDSNHTGWTDITSFSWGASQRGICRWAAAAALVK